MACELNPTVVGTTYEMFAALKEISERGQLLVNITEANQTSLMSGLFDIVIEKLADGNEVVNYKMKVPVSITIQPTGAAGELYWKEVVTLEPQATVNVIGTAVNTVKIDDAKLLRGIGAGARLIVEQAKGVKIVDVLSVSANTITLVAGQVITTAVGQKVYRGAYGVAKGCTVKAQNNYTLPTETQKNTYSRRLYVTYEFNIDDFNIDKASYNYGRTPQMHLESLMQAGNIGANQEFISALWFDESVPVNGTLINGSTAVYSQTMGIIPAIQKAQTATGKKFIKDYTGCTPAAGTTVNVGLVRDFMNEIKNAMHSGAYDKSKKITVHCNKTQSEALIELNQYFSAYKGVTIWENGLQAEHDLISFTIKIGVYMVDFVYEQALNKMAPNEAFYVMMPHDRMWFVQKPFSTISLTDTGDAKLVGPNAFLSAGVPALKFINRSNEETNGEGDCLVFRAFMDFALIIGSIDSGAYRIGYGFRSTTDICNVCVTGANINIIG